MRKKRIINLGVATLQATLLVALFVLEYFSEYRAGVAQHLYYKKIYYESHYFSGIPLLAQLLLLLVLSFVVIGRYKHCGSQLVLNCAKYFILLVALLLCLLLPSVRELNIYCYGLMVLQLCLVLEAVGCVLIKRIM